MTKRTSYTAPALSEIGTLHELTLQFKDALHSDGIIFQGPDGNVSIGNVSS